MARLANAANLGFVPLPEGVADLIAAHIAPSVTPVRFFDACAGEGIAAETIAAALGIPVERRFFNELHDERAKACAGRSSHVVSCDTLKALQATPRAFQLGYLNPPFDHDGREEGGGRLEAKFFRRAIEEGQWIQPGGIAVLVTPQDVLARREIVNHLARCYDALRIFALPDALRSYREAVVFGVVRERRRIALELQAEARRITEALATSLPELVVPSAPLYHLPTPQPVKRVVWRDGSKGTPATAQRDVVSMGGAWRSPAYQTARQQMRRAQLEPLFPLHKPQAALRIAAGAINGTRVAIGDVPQVLKGSTVDQVVEWDEHRSTDSSEITERHRIVRRVPHVVTVDERGTIRRFIGDTGMADLMRREGTAAALLSAVEESAPPIYRLDMEADVATILRTIVPLSGRALPGYAPGLLPMQRHVAAALVRYLRTIHPAAIAALEMGSGKALALDAHLLTPAGWITMGDVQVGDQVIGSDGRPHAVLGVFPQGEKEIYRVQFSDRSYVECCGDHLWQLQSTNHRFRGEPGVVMSLKAFMSDLTMANGNNRWYVPLVEPVEFAARDLPVDPYLLGLLLGDGTLRSDSVWISSIDEEILDGTREAVASLGLQLKPMTGCTFRLSGHRRGNGTNLLLDALRSLGLALHRAEDKFVPFPYHLAPISDRVALLQGLLDSDGTVAKDASIEFTTASHLLVRDVRELVESLGGTARASARVPTYTYNGERRIGQTAYRLCIALPDAVQPFRLRRKADRYRPRVKYPPCRAVEGAELVGIKAAQCIWVDSPDHLYVTDDFVLTHNTSVGAAVAEVLCKLGA